MIVIAGGTGLLGRNVVGRLVARGEGVRVVSRDPVRGRALLGPLADRVEVVAGDVRDRASLEAAMRGADTVVAAVQGFGGREAGGIAAVDRDGNRHLVGAAAAAGASRFLLMSIHDATPADALELGRAKAAVEAELRATAMTPLVVRPTTYMETWAAMIGGPILGSGRARLFGRGRNPINFVSADDVAGIVEELLVEAAPAGGRTVEVVGPEDLSFADLVARFAAALGRPVPVSRVPLPVLRAMALGLRPVNRLLAAQVAAAIVLDTTDRRALPTGQMATAGPPVRVGPTTFDAVIARFLSASTVAAGAIVGA